MRSTHPSSKSKGIIMLKKIIVTLVLASAAGGVAKLIVHHKLNELDNL